MKKTAAFAAALTMAAPAFAQTETADTVRAQYPGGAEAMAEYISANMKYPAQSIAHGIEGVVDLSFLVKVDGSLDNITVVRLIDPDLEAEAVRLAKGMPAWIPAKAGGVPVESEASAAIMFSLPE